MKITLFRYKTSYGLELITCRNYELSVEEKEKVKQRYQEVGDTIISEFVVLDVEIPLLSEETITNNTIKAIDGLIENIKSKAMNRILPLQQKKQELLAITQQVEENFGE